nr:ELWxxDGT repeat protein [uncultured Psychroserpens sp.]
MKKIITLLGLILFTISIIQAQEQLTTFADLTADKDADPTDFFEFNNQLFFLAENDIYGAEIWVTNGDLNNATLLKDINPGVNDGVRIPFLSDQRVFEKRTAILNNELYFIASDGNSRGELWKTDGTTNGTVRITDFLDYDIEEITLVNGELYFFIRTEGQNRDLWKSDGTSSGTLLVKSDIEILNFRYSGRSNNTFIFTTEVSTFPAIFDLWRSDGTETGTYKLAENINNIGFSASDGLAPYFEVNDDLHFLIQSDTIDFGDPNIDSGIMKVNATGTNIVPALGLFDSSTYGIFNQYSSIKVNNKVYISFYRYSNNELDIWEIDLNSTSAQIVYSEESNDFYQTSNLINNGNSLLFCGPNTSDNTTLLSLDLNDYSITEIKELTPSNFGDPCVIKSVNNGTYYISVPTDFNDNEAWLSNLTETSTNRAIEMDNIEEVFPYDNNLFYANLTANQGNELWKFDTLNNMSFQVDNVNPYHEGFREYDANFTGLRKNDIAVINNKIIFGAKDDANGDEPRVYNNIDDTITLLQDINPGSNGSESGGLISGYFEYSNDIYFSAFNPTNGEELWRTDGTVNETSINQDIFTGSSSSDPRFFVESQGLLYFLVGNSPQLWSTDGTNRTFIKSLGSAFAIDMVAKNDTIYISLINSNTLDFELWVSDGTAQGTTILKSQDSVGQVTITDNFTFFTSRDNNNGDTELWRTDGTVAGTQLVKDIGVGYSSIPNGLIAFGNNVIFSAFTNENGRELWISDGTESGTIQLKDIFIGANGSLDFNSEFFATDEFIYFTANDGTTGTELWRTDGTEAGTVLVKDINSGISGSNATEFIEINNTIYFQAFEASQGSELWKTDGTEAGTINVTDAISPGISGSVPRDMISSEGDLFFTAVTEAHGRQLWKIAGETLSNESFEEATEILLYPNPSKNTIHFKSIQPITNATIFSLNGQLIKTFNNIENNTIDISELTTGLYLIEYQSNGKHHNGKIIKQ